MWMNLKAFEYDKVQLNHLELQREGIIMRGAFVDRVHEENFADLVKEWGSLEEIDCYWRSLLYIISGNENLFTNRSAIYSIHSREILSEKWGVLPLSGGEERLLLLAYVLFTNLSFYESVGGANENISIIDIFSVLDDRSYKLAKNALDVRFNKMSFDEI